jgi:hypothetical protein
MPQGGHFAAMEQPELLAKDLWEFFRGLRKEPALRSPITSCLGLILLLQHAPFKNLLQF